MLKQEIAHAESLESVTSPSSLPPLNNLPQWSRINTLDRARYPKPFLKDRLQPLPSTSSQLMEQGSMDSDDNDSQIADTMDPRFRIQHLEKSIQFLKSQHHEVLTNLHDEIERVKRENKELQFRIVSISKNPSSPDVASPPHSGSSHSSKKKQTKAILEQPKSHKETTAISLKSVKLQHDLDLQEVGSDSQASDEKLEELKIIFLEEEIKDLKRSLKEETNRNNYLTQLLEQTEKQQRRIHQSSQEEKDGYTSANSGQERRILSGTASSAPSTLPFHATLDPLQIRTESKMTRAPNLSECEMIIKHLQRVNDKQAHELNQLKSDLRDVLYSHKWTPDAYLLAKAYIAEDDAKEAAVADQRLPRIQLKHQTRKLPDIAYISKDAVSLPALKTTVGNKAVERRKRTQILQKARLRREGSARVQKAETVDN